MLQQNSCNQQNCPSNCCSPKGDCLTQSTSGRNRCKPQADPTSFPPSTPNSQNLPVPSPASPQKINESTVSPPPLQNFMSQNHHKTNKRKDQLTEQNSNIPIQFAVPIIVMTILLLIIIALLIWQKCKAKKNKDRKNKQPNHHKTHSLTYVGHLYPNNRMQDTANDLLPYEMQQNNYGPPPTVRNNQISSYPVYELYTPSTSLYQYQYQDSKKQMYSEGKQKTNEGLDCVSMQGKSEETQNKQ